MNLVATQLFVKSLLAVKRQVLLILLFALPVYAQDASVANSAAPDITANQSAEINSATPPSSSTPTNVPLTQTNVPLTQTNAPVTQTNTVAPIGSGRHLMNVTLALMGIIGLIFAISWFVKRFSQGTFSANAHIKVLSTMPLGTRERIVLIDAGGQQLLLGITSTNINTLHVFETPIAIDNKVDPQSDFSRKLMSILQQKSPPLSASDLDNKNNSAP